MQQPWNLETILAAVEDAYIQHGRLTGPLAASLAGARLSHARVRFSTRDGFNAVRGQALQSTQFSHRRITDHKGRQILWLKRKPELFAPPRPPLAWLELTETKPGDRNMVDALVFKLPTLHEAVEKQVGTALKPFFLRFQPRSAHDILAQHAA